MNAIATCDKKHRLIVRDAIPGKQYLMQGLAIKAVEEPKPAAPEKVVYGELAEKDGVWVLDFGREFPDEELGQAIVEGLRQDGRPCNERADKILTRDGGFAALGTGIPCEKP